MEKSALNWASTQYLCLPRVSCIANCQNARYFEWSLSAKDRPIACRWYCCLSKKL